MSTAFLKYLMSFFTAFRCFRKLTGRYGHKMLDFSYAFHPSVNFVDSMPGRTPVPAKQIAARSSSCRPFTGWSALLCNRLRTLTQWEPLVGRSPYCLPTVPRNFAARYAAGEVDFRPLRAKRRKGCLSPAWEEVSAWKAPSSTPDLKVGGPRRAGPAARFRTFRPFTGWSELLRNRPQTPQGKAFCRSVAGRAASLGKNIVNSSPEVEQAAGKEV